MGYVLFKLGWSRCVIYFYKRHVGPTIHPFGDINVAFTQIGWLNIIRHNDPMCKGTGNYFTRSNGSTLEGHAYVY